MWFIVPKNVYKPLLPQPLGQSPSFDQFEFWPLRRWRPARVMPFYFGALRMLNTATGYSKNTLSCSELNEEHAGEGFRSLRYILTPLWACKAKKCHFSRKFDLWPDLTRSNIDLGPQTICAIARSCRGASTGLFCEALRPSGADHQGGGSYQPPPPWPSALWEMPWPGEGYNIVCCKELGIKWKYGNAWYYVQMPWKVAIFHIQIAIKTMFMKGITWNLVHTFFSLF